MLSNTSFNGVFPCIGITFQRGSPLVLLIEQLLPVVSSSCTTQPTSDERDEKKKKRTHVIVEDPGSLGIRNPYFSFAVMTGWMTSSHDLSSIHPRKPFRISGIMSKGLTFDTFVTPKFGKQEDLRFRLYREDFVFEAAS